MKILLSYLCDSVALCGAVRCQNMFHLDRTSAVDCKIRSNSDGCKNVPDAKQKFGINLVFYEMEVFWKYTD